MVFFQCKSSIWFLCSGFFKFSRIPFFLQGMDFTTDKLRSLVRKWQTLIEAHVDVKTTDNYTLRMFCIAFTKRRPNQVKRTCYAQSSQIRQVNPCLSAIIFQKIATMLLFKLPFFFRSAVRWEKSWLIKLPHVTWRIWFWSLFLSQLEKKLRRQPQVFILSRMCSFAKLKSWKPQSLILGSLWRYDTIKKFYLPWDNFNFLVVFCLPIFFFIETNLLCICFFKVHGDYSKEDIGAKVDRPAEDTPMDAEQQPEIVGA